MGFARKDLFLITEISWGKRWDRTLRFPTFGPSSKNNKYLEFLGFKGFVDLLPLMDSTGPIKRIKREAASSSATKTRGEDH
ncbi:hypothetical protein DUNSADRAFT_14386, partial [Dunaliella salina]